MSFDQSGVESEGCSPRAVVAVNPEKLREHVSSMGVESFRWYVVRMSNLHETTTIEFHGISSRTQEPVFGCLIRELEGQAPFRFALLRDLWPIVQKPYLRALDFSCLEAKDASEHRKFTTLLWEEVPNASNFVIRRSGKPFVERRVASKDEVHAHLLRHLPRNHSIFIHQMTTATTTTTPPDRDSGINLQQQQQQQQQKQQQQQQQPLDDSNPFSAFLNANNGKESVVIPATEKAATILATSPPAMTSTPSTARSSPVSMAGRRRTPTPTTSNSPRPSIASLVLEREAEEWRLQEEAVDRGVRRSFDFEIRRVSEDFLAMSSPDQLSPIASNNTNNNTNNTNNTNDKGINKERVRSISCSLLFDGDTPTPMQDLFIADANKETETQNCWLEWDFGGGVVDMSMFDDDMRVLFSSNNYSNDDDADYLDDDDDGDFDCTFEDTRFNYSNNNENEGDGEGDNSDVVAISPNSSACHYYSCCNSSSKKNHSRNNTHKTSRCNDSMDSCEDNHGVGLGDNSNNTNVSNSRRKSRRVSRKASIVSTASSDVCGRDVATALIHKRDSLTFEESEELLSFLVNSLDLHTKPTKFKKPCDLPSIDDVIFLEGSDTPMRVNYFW